MDNKIKIEVSKMIRLELDRFKQENLSFRSWRHVDTPTDSFTATNKTVTVSGFVLKAGDTMTGALILSGAPSASNGAATKNFVEQQHLRVLENFTTGGRPAASSAGRVIYNTTTNKPNFADGSNWRDAAGTIV